MEEHKLCWCSDDEVDPEVSPLSGTKFVIVTLTLGAINFAVIFGNSLVIAAVCTTRKLRTVTNMFIVSLAFADFSLGCVILPFSISNQVLSYWIFGESMCTAWLAVDVWMSTASIINLCAISFDRFIAITRPITYPNILSHNRARCLTAFVWVCAFAICLPPLLGWKNFKTECSTVSTSNYTTLIPDSFFTEIDQNITSYVNVSFRPTSLLARSQSQTPYLLATTSNCHKCYCKCTLVDTSGYRIYSAMGSFYVPMFVMIFFYIRIYVTAVKTASSLRKGVLQTKSSDKTTKCSNDTKMRIHTGRNRKRMAKNGSADMSKSMKFSSATDDQKSQLMLNNHCVENPRFTRKKSDVQISYLNDDCGVKVDDGAVEHDIDHCSSGDDTTDKLTKRGIFVVKGGKFNMKLHSRKFKRETKAAKTLAIIVGAFILCWLPFFTVYLIGAFRKDLISDLLFDVLFWLGYCNSAINPCIYAACARDFRQAFRRILCLCCQFHEKKTLKSSLILKTSAHSKQYKKRHSLSDT